MSDSTIARRTKWARAVKRRDGSCRTCGAVSDLTAHHVKSWERHPEARFDVSNGVTLCRQCHKNKHTAKKSIVTGEVGQWMQVGRPFTSNGRKKVQCICACGIEKTVRYCDFISGHSKSCGCQTARLKSEKVSGVLNPSYKHGQSRRGRWSKEYRAWTEMKNRCTNPNCTVYDLYGGRGIKISQYWLDSFDQFINDVGVAPGQEYQLDRIDVNGNYEPLNCRWADRITQSNNKTTNRFIEIDGHKLTYTQWEIHKGLKPKTISRRKAAGWSDERCLTPIRKCGNGS